MNDVLPVGDSSAYRKATLIREALETLRAARHIDERDDLNAASFVEWYDRTIPDVQDIKMLAGAMEIELARRRGEQILQEGERRGRPTKVEQRSTFVSQSERDQRKAARALAAAPEAVQAFVQREVKAGKVPSMRGAVGVARTARATASPERRLRQVQAAQGRRDEVGEQILAVLTRIADGTRRTDAQLVKLTGFRDIAGSLLDRIRLLPWLRIDRTPDGLAFHIDEPLRAICEGRLPRPALSYQSMNQFLRNLRAEITRRRKENHDEFLKRRWNSELILKREQTSLLDWIEQQLDRVPPL